MAQLDLGVIGNGTYGALLDTDARIVWACLPRFDGDPVFHELLNGGDAPHELAPGRAHGVWAIELVGQTRSEQAYIENTAILSTKLWDDKGNGIEIVDFAPRFERSGRMFRPMSLVRRVRTLSGTPRIRVVLRPAFGWGADPGTITTGSNHVRFVGDTLAFRVTTNVPISYVVEERAFHLHEPISMILMPDESLTGAVESTAREWMERTAHHWKQWVRELSIPFEWQEAVIRAAITLKLCTFEETGAIIAAMTTSVPEFAHSGRNWDYRYCWLRDAFFVVRALNALAEVETMEHYLRYVTDVVDGRATEHIQPVLGITGETALTEHIVEHLPGFRGMGPVRRGNQAHEHFQHDVYGNVVLAASQAFFDARLFRPGGLSDFTMLEAVGDAAWRMHDQPDAGMWELRTMAHVHTSSSLMCWAACDRLARIAERLDLPERATHWRTRADTIHSTICREAWNEELGSFAATFGGSSLDASLLLMAEVNFLPADDPRFLGTLEAVEKRLLHGEHLYRYADADDFGLPETAFNICTFWYIDALARVGRTDEARAIFEGMLAARNHVGLLSEDLDPETGDLWGNYPQTYSLVGIIQAAKRLSRPWEKEI